MGAITAASQPAAAIPADYLTTTALLQMSQLNALAGLTPFTAAAVPDFTASLLAHQQQQQQQATVCQTGSPPASAPQVGAQAQLAALSASLAATLPPSDTAGYCLFVYNLCQETDDQLLWQLFSPFGAVVNVKVSSLFCKCALNSVYSVSQYTEYDDIFEFSIETWDSGVFRHTGFENDIQELSKNFFLFLF